MQANLLAVIKAYGKKLEQETGIQTVIMPSLVKSEKFHVELSLLPHPVLVGNGRVRLRLRATVFAEIPASDRAINDCLACSLTLAQFFDQAEGFTVTEGNGVEKGVYGTAYHTPLRSDDELFTDLQESEQRSFSYNESWLVELEINSDDVR